jgi:hypothetical protein
MQALSLIQMIQNHNRGYVFTLNRGAFSWKSSKQGTVAESTTEVEYIVASEAAKEGIWIKKFMI